MLKLTTQSSILRNEEISENRSLLLFLLRIIPLLARSSSSVSNSSPTSRSPRLPCFCLLTFRPSLGILRSGFFAAIDDSLHASSAFRLSRSSFFSASLPMSSLPSFVFSLMLPMLTPALSALSPERRFRRYFNSEGFRSRHSPVSTPSLSCTTHSECPRSRPFNPSPQTSCPEDSSVRTFRVDRAMASFLNS